MPRVGLWLISHHVDWFGIFGPHSWFNHVGEFNPYISIEGFYGIWGDMCTVRGHASLELSVMCVGNYEINSLI